MEQLPRLKVMLNQLKEMPLLLLPLRETLLPLLPLMGMQLHRQKDLPPPKLLSLLRLLPRGKLLLKGGILLQQVMDQLREQMEQEGTYR